VTCAPPSRSSRGGPHNPRSPAHEHRERTPLILLLLLAVVTHSVRAHDLYEIWTIAVLRTDQLELGITMAQATALRLIDPQSKVAAITAENLSAHRERLEKEAATLCVLTTGRNQLAARKVEVELTEENDIVFRIIYPRPPPGRLHFQAGFLKKLGQGYGGLFDANDSVGKHLGWDLLSFQNPNIEITIPASSPAAAKSPS
jgi:hypothetical protein